MKNKINNIIEQNFVIDRLTNSILIKHYEDTLGAYHFKNQRMIIETEPARLLVEKYFKD